MKKITYLVVLAILIVQTALSQDKHSRVKIINPTEQTIETIALQGIDLSCGSKHEGNDLIIELSDEEINKLELNNISFTVEIDDLTQFYSTRAEMDLPIAVAQLKAAKISAASNTTVSAQRSSISSVVLDNIIQYAECDEIDFVEPQNFNLGTMAGCLRYDEMKAELDDMYTYSQNNSLDIVSQKANASSTGQKTWGNPTNNFVNQQNNGPATYSGVGSTRWDPETVWYVRITGNQSTSPEGSKPQMLFTSMIHSREVSALMNNIYFMWYIIENYDTDPAIQELVNNNELYFVPVVNPDGLRWNETLSPSGGGLQRKNLRPNTGGTGTNRGVDLNRNFDYFWNYNNIGSSGTATSGTYRGPSPESEPETQIMVDFITSRSIKSGVWNHSYANSVPHPYGGVPSASTGREDEYYRWHEEMTRYNRYLYGATIFYESNGLPDDWMMGGSPDNNGSTGSGQAIIATTPEHGGQGFWPTPSTLVPIAKQSMRISLATAYYGGKYAKFHDLTQSNVGSLTSDLFFGIERIGQTASDFTVTVTPISANITSIVSPSTETGIAVLEQRTVSATLNLNPAITANEKIEYNVKLSNDVGIIYEANYEKYYQPTLLFDHNPDATGLTGWTQSGGWTSTTSNSYDGSDALSTGTYSNNATKTLTTTNAYDFSSSNEVILQFYSKWDIERNYDFVEVLGSPDGGTNWISLCGVYTKPNATSSTTSHDNKSSTYANFQANSSGQVYDGDRMDNWVMEEITINGDYASLLNSNNVKIRFNFRTDALNVNESYTTTNDGFFIDDFKIISVQIPCQTTVPTNVTVSNITTLSAQVDWDEVPSATYDLRYRESGSGPSGWITISDHATNSYVITGLTATTDYDVQVRTRCITNTSAYSATSNFTTAAPVPCTGSSISSYPYSESFENTLGLWTNDVATDDFNWTVKQEETDGNSTPSAGTGPSLSSDGSYFLYIEASNPNFPSKTARLVSPCLDFTGRQNATLLFDYHMFGDFIGVLTVDVSIDNGISYSTLNDYTLLGSQQTSHIDAWKTQNVDLSIYDGQVIKLRFSATTDSDATTGWSGDIAIDKFEITSDPAGSAPPVAVCQNITVQLDNAGNATILANDVDGGSTDDVAIISYSIDIDTFDCTNIGTPVDVTLTVTDGDNQSDTCIATVTVVDQVNPEFINVPSNITLTCGNNQPTWTDPTVTDNCATGLSPSRTDGTGLNSGDVFPSGITTISYSTNDGNGNSNTASFNVNVEVDNQNPTAICQNISIQLDAGGNATITATEINNNSTDNCGIASISASQTSFTCANEGTNNVTLTVTDTNGNMDTCVAVVTVTIQDAPTGLECWETANYNYTTCSWEVTGSQDPEPTTECWETATFDTDNTSPTYCTWVVTGSQDPEPTTECWETATFDTNNTSPTYCTWVITGSQDPEPTTECWETATFDTDNTSPTYCTWVITGTQPTEPTTECWETATFDTDDTSPTYCTWVVTGSQPAEPTTECWETATFDTDNTSPTYCTWVITGTQPTAPTTECWETATFDTDDTSPTYCTWVVTGTQPAEPTTECWETATFDNDDTSLTYCTWVVTGTQPTEPTATNCWDDYQFNNTSCAWENQGSQPIEPTTECYETATFDTDNTSPTYCTWVVTGSQPAEPTTECWETATFDTDDTSPTYCTWVVTGSQPTEPTATNCWDDYQFNNTSCAWENQGTQPTEPTTECWETATFDTDNTSLTYCTWVVTGTQPTEPTATNCWDNYQFNNTSCEWENQGSQPAEPTTECYETATFDTDNTSPTYCTWVVSGSQPAEPTTECWETATFDTDDTSPTYCTWVVTGSQPSEPTTECWETATFDTDDTSPTYCTWIVTGSQPIEPTTECWETANFDTDDTSPTYCTWVVTGSQPAEPTATNCWDNYQFNNTSCEWENQGSQPAEPTTECWETATFDTDDTSPTYCTWVVTGSQPVEPSTECWETATFDTDDTSPTYCSWVVTGSQPAEPTTECYETATFDTDDTSLTYCTWVVTGSQPAEPTTECWEMATFDTDDTSPTYCTWVVTGSQPVEPSTECWETATFDTDDTSPTYCSWVVTGTQPAEPTTECYETATFDTDDTSPTYCTWVITGTQPVEPTTECYETATFDTDDTSPTYCTWVVTGSQPTEPTTECWETATFDTDDTSLTYCTWVVTGTQPNEPTATNCWDDYQFNNTSCEWENQGIAPTPPTGVTASTITDTQATITWDAMTGVTFDLRYREVGTSVWTEILDISTNSQTLTLLSPLTQYVVQVRSKCSVESASEWSTAIDFTTLDAVLNYCASSSNNASEEYISRVQLNTIDNTSGGQTYSDFTSISTNLTEGTQYTISITPIWVGTVYNESYSVWIDYNRDGDFDDAGEQVFTQGNTQATLITGNFTIPQATSRQKTRMRVSMKYNALPTPCETFSFGEVEDYSVTLYGSDDLIYSNSAWTPYGPSPTTVSENAIVLDGTYSVTDDIQINNVTVNDGAGIIIEKSKSLTVNGDMITNDNVILESDSNEYASLIVNNLVIGKALYKRHVNTTASIGGNDLIAPPVYGESFLDFRAVNPNIVSNAANTLFLFGPFDKITDTYLIYSNTETATLDAGTGYRAASTDNITFTFTGQVETGNVSVPVRNDGPSNPEWNLVGNPYPSYIELSDFLLANNAQFDFQRAGIYGYDGYASDGWTIWNQAYSDANPNAIITPGQGFLIASATNNGQIDFTSTMRRIGNADDFILGRNANINHLQLEMYNPIEGTYKTDFYFTDNASNGMDFNYDASIFGDVAPSDFALYSQLIEENNGIDMAIQSLGFDALSDAVIPLGVHFPEGQQITVSISESDIPDNIEVYLEDTLNNTFTLLNNSDYIITPNEDLSNIGRYFLRFNAETLGINSSTGNDIKIYTTTQPKMLYVKGQLYEDSNLTIYDIQGRLIKTITLTNSQTSHSIDVSDFQTGVYMVSVKNGSQEKMQKVVIK